VHENVVWISGRTYPVAAMFGLALCLWTLASGERPRWQRQAVGVLLLTLALASYEFAVVLPVLVTSVLIVQRRGHGYRHSLARALVVTWPLFVTLVAYLAFRWIWLTNVGSDIVVAARASQWAPAVGPLHERALRNGLFFGLKVLAWPWFERGSEITWSATALMTSALVVAAVVRLVWDRDRRPYAALWLFWIVVCFAPVAGYAGFADRFGYLSVAGLAGLLGSAAAVVLTQDHRIVARSAMVALAALTVAWAAELRGRAQDWVDAARLAEQVVAATLRVEPGPAAPVDLHFVGVPERQRSALVLITYFPQAVWKHYGTPAREHVTFHMSWEPVDRVLEKLDHSVPGRDVRVYQWRPTPWPWSAFVGNAYDVRRMACGA
jgi:hypothetical protein